MKASKTQLVRALPGSPGTSLGQRLRGVLASRAEEILAEVAPTLRQVRTLLLVITICIPLFVVGFVAALWHLAH